MKVVMPLKLHFLMSMTKISKLVFNKISKLNLDLLKFDVFLLVLSCKVIF